MRVHPNNIFKPLRPSLRAQRSSRLLAVLLSTSAVEQPLGSFLGQAQFETAKRLAVSEKWDRALPVEDFLRRGGVLPGADGVLSKRVPIIDVRAPCEYEQGHVPGAISVPLFTDDERAEVGTLYKQEGHDVAVDRGLEIVDKKGWEGLLRAAPQLSAGESGRLSRR